MTVALRARLLASFLIRTTGVRYREDVQNSQMSGVQIHRKTMITTEGVPKVVQRP